MSKSKGMKQTEIIPLMKFNDIALPFSISTISRWMKNYKKPTLFLIITEYYEISRLKKEVGGFMRILQFINALASNLFFSFIFIHKCERLLLYKEVNFDMKSERI
jgi:hypothetical protein